MNPIQPHSLFTDFDIDLFKAGKHFRLYEKMGAHVLTLNGVKGTYFAVWAPAAKAVSVIGDFNSWDASQHLLQVRWDRSGIWEGFIPGVTTGALYKYSITSPDERVFEKADPYATYCQKPPETASVIWDLQYNWQDAGWISGRNASNSLHAPWSVYEVQLGSWQRQADGRFLTYLELADKLVAYVLQMGFTHVELMPVMEYPYDPSWGYQLTGYFAPSSRFGTPEELMFLIDAFHQAGIGVILDWVPSHFPDDSHGLGYFDGSHLYEHPDSRKGYHPDWKSLVFNYGRNEVRSFLISNAFFWLDRYHADGLRVDAVASMLYLDYSRGEGGWEPNILGGRENLEAISFLKDFNQAVYGNFEGIQTIAEESTAFPKVSRPTYDGGLGFGMKWMMGWMHDTLNYFKRDTIYRPYHQNDLTFSMTYAYSENFMLPLSHDEVVHGKSAMLNKMPGDQWQNFANLRLLYGYMYTHPGAKLLFMGAEFGQTREWDFSGGLSWDLLQYDFHLGLQNYVAALNTLYKNYPALYEKQFHPEGFSWIDHTDHAQAILVYRRHGNHATDTLIVACNFTPQVHESYQIGMEQNGHLIEIFNSDSPAYHGSGVVNTNTISMESQPYKGMDFSAFIKLPPLGIAVFLWKA